MREDRWRRGVGDWLWNEHAQLIEELLPVGDGVLCSECWLVLDEVFDELFSSCQEWPFEVVIMPLLRFLGAWAAFSTEVIEFLVQPVELILFYR